MLRDRRAITIPIFPDPRNGAIGVTVTLYQPPTRDHSLALNEIGSRFLNLGNIYLNSAASLTRSPGPHGERPPAISGPILGAHQTAQAVQYAGAKAWIAILGAITMSVAVLNLLPIPPLDGYRMVIQSVEALRHGRPLNPKVDQAMTLCGLAAIGTAFIYLTFNDLLHLLE